MASWSAPLSESRFWPDSMCQHLAFDQRHLLEAVSARSLPSRPGRRVLQVGRKNRVRCRDLVLGCPFLAIHLYLSAAQPPIETGHTNSDPGAPVWRLAGPELSAKLMPHTQLALLPSQPTSAFVFALSDARRAVSSACPVYCSQRPCHSYCSLRYRRPSRWQLAEAGQTPEFLVCQLSC